MSEWQPIETAPKDGVPVIVTGGPILGYELPCVIDAVFEDGAWHANMWCTPDGEISPTHWKPRMLPGGT